MMEIELTKNTVIEGVPYEAGALVDCVPRIAEKLTRRGLARIPEKPKPKTKPKLKG
jgi:hypothetical protein